MKLIVQNIDGDIFAYTEKERHFKAVEKSRGGKRLDPKVLGNDCNMGAYPNSYFVLDVKKPK